MCLIFGPMKWKTPALSSVTSLTPAGMQFLIVPTSIKSFCSRTFCVPDQPLTPGMHSWGFRMKDCAATFRLLRRHCTKIVIWLISKLINWHSHSFSHKARMSSETGSFGENQCHLDFWPILTKDLNYNFSISSVIIHSDLKWAECQTPVGNRIHLQHVTQIESSIHSICENLLWHENSLNPKGSSMNLWLIQVNFTCQLHPGSAGMEFSERRELEDFDFCQILFRLLSWRMEKKNNILAESIWFNKCKWLKHCSWNRKRPKKVQLCWS